MDLSKLTPAPWTAVPFRQDAKGNTWIDLADAAFIALARNAFDVMMGPLKINPEWYADGWGVGSGKIHLPIELERMRWPDPLTAVVEGRKWYRENVESKEKQPS